MHRLRRRRLSAVRDEVLHDLLDERAEVVVMPRRVALELRHRGAADVLLLSRSRDDGVPADDHLDLVGPRVDEGGPLAVDEHHVAVVGDQSEARRRDDLVGVH